MGKRKRLCVTEKKRMKHDRELRMILLHRASALLVANALLLSIPSCRVASSARRVDERSPMNAARSQWECSQSSSDRENRTHSLLRPPWPLRSSTHSSGELNQPTNGDISRHVLQSSKQIGSNLLHSLAAGSCKA